MQQQQSSNSALATEKSKVRSVTRAGTRLTSPRRSPPALAVSSRSDSHLTDTAACIRSSGATQFVVISRNKIPGADETVIAPSEEPSSKAARTRSYGAFLPVVPSRNKIHGAAQHVITQTEKQNGDNAPDAFRATRRMFSWTDPTSDYNYWLSGLLHRDSICQAKNPTS